MLYFDHFCMRTNKLIVLSCLFLLIAIPANLAVFAFLYHTDYEHTSAVSFANDAAGKTGLQPSPTIFHFQPNVITAKQREQLKNTEIPTESAKTVNSDTLVLNPEPTVFLARKEEPTPEPTIVVPTPIETKAKEVVVPTPTLFIPQPTPTPQPKTVASEPVRSSSAVVVETPASSVIIEPNSPVAQPSAAPAVNNQPQVCGEGEFC